LHDIVFIHLGTRLLNGAHYKLLGLIEAYAHLLSHYDLRVF